MEKYRCYYCNSEVFCLDSNMPDELDHDISSHCHIMNIILCSNPNCEAQHVEETDINDYLIFFGPFNYEERL